MPRVQSPDHRPLEATKKLATRLKVRETTLQELLGDYMLNTLFARGTISRRHGDTCGQ